jgi:hypothetical protein
VRVFVRSAIWGTLVLAISGSAFAGYRYFAFKTGFCATTLSFNSLEDIERITVDRMLPYIGLYKTNEPAARPVRQPFSSYDELKLLNPGCCKTNPGGGDSYPFRPSLFDYAMGWKFAFNFGASRFKTVSGEIDKYDYATVFSAKTFKIDNCGRYQRKYWPYH